MGMKKNTNSKIFIGSNTKFLELTLKKCIADSKEDYCKDIESRVQAFILDQTHYSTFTVWFFTSFFQKHVLVLDMASGRIDESQLSSDEEKEVFASFTIKGIEKMQQAHQARQEQNLLRNVDDDRKDFFNLRSQERGSDSDVELYASDEEEESDESNNEESATEESQPNALQWSSTLQQIKVKQFSIHHGPTRDLGKKCNCQRFLQCTYRRCLHWWNCPINSCISSFKRRSNVHNNPSRNFSLSRAEHSHWNPWTSSAGNVLGFWQVYWSWSLQKNNPKVPLHDSGEIFTSCRLDCRRPKQSPLQSLLPYNSLGAEVCQIKEQICIWIC